jgi:hypothetical protein
MSDNNKGKPDAKIHIFEQRFLVYTVTKTNRSASTIIMPCVALWLNLALSANLDKLTVQKAYLINAAYSVLFIFYLVFNHLIFMKARNHVDKFFKKLYRKGLDSSLIKDENLKTALSVIIPIFVQLCIVMIIFKWV